MLLYHIITKESWNPTITQQNHNTSIKPTLCWHVWAPQSSETTRSKNIHQPPATTQIPARRAVDPPQTPAYLKSHQSGSNRFRPMTRRQKRSAQRERMIQSHELTTLQHPQESKTATAANLTVSSQPADFTITRRNGYEQYLLIQLCLLSQFL